MTDENKMSDADLALPLSAEIAGLCSEFPEIPIIEIARHALAHGAALTRQRLIAGHTSLSTSDGKETP